MNLDAIWLIVLATATPIAGVVGFAIQLRTVKKVRLENRKLALEIANLERALLASKSQIVIPTNEEVLRIVHHSRLGDLRCETRQLEVKSRRPWIVLLIAAAAGWYVVYDLIRFARWLYGLF